MAAISGYTPIGMAGYTSPVTRPQTSIAKNGVVSTTLGASGLNPAGNYSPVKPMNAQRPREDILPGGEVPRPEIPNPKPVPKPKPKPTWQDADYNSQVAAIDRALELYKANIALQRGQLGTQYAESGREMDDQKVRDLDNMEEDFAARGVVRSGVYGTSVGDYNEEWGNQKASLTRQYNDSLANIVQQYNEYLNEVATQREQARLDAIRRAAQALEENPKKKKKETKKLGKSSLNYIGSTTLPKGLSLGSYR